MSRLLIISLLFLAAFEAYGEWKVDFSRRRGKSDYVEHSNKKLMIDEQVVESDDMVPPPPGDTNMVMPYVAKPKKAKIDPSIRKLVARSRDRDRVKRQSFVILNTEHGFIPSTVNIYAGGHYVIHVVNVNEKKKNVSFVLDGFREHHATYFSEIKSFKVDPKSVGVYAYQCPETASEGKLVVLGPKSVPPVMRALSSEETP